MSRHLLVTNDFPPKIGGIQSYLWELWRRLPPEDVTVLTSPHADDDLFDRDQPFRIERTREPVLLPNPVLARLIAVLAWSVAALNITQLLGPTLEMLDSAAIIVGGLRVSLLTVTKGVLSLTLLLWAATLSPRYSSAGSPGSRRLRRGRGFCRGSFRRRGCVRSFVRSLAVFIAGHPFFQCCDFRFQRFNFSKQLGVAAAAAVG